MTENKTIEFKRLDIDTANKIGGAFARLQELGGNVIVDNTTAAERRGIEAFLAASFQTYGLELMGCWFAVQNEFRPLVQGFAALINRAEVVLQQSRAEAKAAAAAQEQAPASTENHTTGDTKAAT